VNSILLERKENDLKTLQDSDITV